jgi:hypothetical protein
MKTAVLLLLAIALVLSHPSRAADVQPLPESVDEIVKQRIAILTKIVEARKEQFKAGQGTVDQNRSATRELYAFCRDSAKTPAERLSWQERIVAFEQEVKADIDKRVLVGSVSTIDALRAAERVLAAEQKRLELQAAK